MPQLMPLSWDYSILMVLMILMLKVLLYSNNFSLHLNVMKSYSKKKLSWWW